MNTENVFVLNLDNKFWGMTSVVVPCLNSFNRKMTQLKPLREVLGGEELKAFEVYWFEQDITGETKLPGEWNYCKIGDNFYHLEKTKSDGRFGPDGKEYFFYSIIYDDWANLFLKNKINVVGSVSKTGDREKVLANIVQVPPLLTNLNDRMDFDFEDVMDKNEWDLKKPSDKFYKDNKSKGINPIAKFWLEEFYKRMKGRWESILDDNKFTLPVYIQEQEWGSGKITIIEALLEYLSKGVTVYDVDKSLINYANFISMYPQEEVYSISNARASVKQVSKTAARGKWISKIDLSGLTDIVELDANFHELEKGKNTFYSLAKEVYEKYAGKVDSNYKPFLPVFILKFAEMFFKQTNLIGRKLFYTNGQYWPKFNGILNLDQRKEIGIFENVEVEYNPPSDWTFNGKTTSVRQLHGESTLHPFELLGHEDFAKNGIIQRGRIIRSGDGYFLGIKENVNLDEIKFPEYDFTRFSELPYVGEGSKLIDEKYDLSGKISFSQLINFYKKHKEQWGVGPGPEDFGPAERIEANQISQGFRLFISNIFRYDELSFGNKRDGYQTKGKNNEELKKYPFLPVFIHRPFPEARFINETENIYTTEKLFATFFSAVHEFYEKPAGGARQRINELKNGIALLPDYQNHGFVPAAFMVKRLDPDEWDINTHRAVGVREPIVQEWTGWYNTADVLIHKQYEPHHLYNDDPLLSGGYKEEDERAKTINIFKSPLKQDKKNKEYVQISELLSDSARLEVFDIDKPIEKILEDNNGNKVPQTIRDAEFIKALIRQEPWRFGFSMYGSYSRQTNKYYQKGDFDTLAKYVIAKSSISWRWRLTVPTNTIIDIEKLLEEFKDVPDSCFQWFNPKKNTSKGNHTKDKTQFITVVPDNKDYGNYRKLDELPEYVRDKIIYIMVDPVPRSYFSENEKELLKKLCDKLFDFFYKEDGNTGINYKAKTVPLCIAPTGDSDAKPFEILHARPYNNFGYLSRVLFEMDPDDEHPEHTKRLRTGGSDFSPHKWLYIAGVDNTSYAAIFRMDKKGAIIGMNGMNREDARDRMLYILLGNGFGSETTKYPGIGEQMSYYTGDSSGWNAHKANWDKFYAVPFLGFSHWKKASGTTKDKINTNPDSESIDSDLKHEKNKEEKNVLGGYEPSEQEIPHFVYKGLNPNTPGSYYHGLTLNIGKINSEGGDWAFSMKDSRGNLNYNAGKIGSAIEMAHQFEEHTIKAIEGIHKTLPTGVFYLDLKGTDFIAACTYNAAAGWDFELLIKNPNNVLRESGRKKVIFKNNYTDPEDGKLEKIINSVNELNIYGHKIPIKDRFDLNGEDIDLGIHIEHLEDKYQSASDWFYIGVNSRDSTIQTQIEVPKESAITSTMSVADKHQLHQSFIYNNAERYFEKANYDHERHKYFAELDLEQKYADIRNQQGIFGVVTRGLTGLVGVAQTALMGKAMAGTPGALMGAVAGGAQAVGNIISDVWGYFTGGGEEQQKRQLRREIGLQMFSLRDEAMRSKHMEAERLERIAIANAATANTYPSNNNALIYRSYNHVIGRGDVYLTQYRPQGKLLEMLKAYYDENGFDILLNDETIRGIDGIHKHIKFLTIKENHYPNSTIRAMIEARLTTGIKVLEERID